MDDLANLRHRLKAGGYSPIPCEGKRPPMRGWDEKINANDDEIELWSRLYPYATNTGVFTRLVPTIDIDILDPEAAQAIEMLVRERHEEHGNILVRFGLSPKRAIPFRTDEPFSRISRSVIAPDGSAGQKVELLGDGQQFIVAGVHPDTRRPYSWHGGTLAETKREMLPYVREDDARELVDAAIELLVKEFGYRLPPERPKKQPEASGGPADWRHLIAAIREGRDPHDSLRDLGGKLRAGGLHAGAAVNLLRAHMQESTAPRDDRWTARYDDIPRLIGNIAEAPPTTVFDPWAEYQVPAFPLDILPPVARDFVAEQSVLIGCDPAAMAMAVLATFSGALSRALRVSNRASLTRRAMKMSLLLSQKWEYSAAHRYAGI